MKIAFFEIEDWEKKEIRKRIKGHQIYFFDKELNQKNVSKISNVDIICVFIYSDINKKILDRLKDLKAIVTRSTGFDHIDIRVCRKRNIKVLNVPNYGENTVAEHAFALILALSKNIHTSYNKTKAGKFSQNLTRSFDLMGKTIGIIGMGRIGNHVAKIANGFEMKIIAYSPKKEKGLEKKFNFKYVTLDYLLKNSDIITLHAPYKKETHHLLNKKNILKIKRGACLINAARGGLVDTEALIKALDKKILSGAGLDVLEEEDLLKEKKKKNLTKEERESLIENHKLMKYKNVVITPHSAFNTLGALGRILDTTIKNIELFSEGRIIKENLVV